MYFDEEKNVMTFKQFNQTIRVIQAYTNIGFSWSTAEQRALKAISKGCVDGNGVFIKWYYMFDPIDTICDLLYFVFLCCFVVCVFFCFQFQ